MEPFPSPNMVKYESNILGIYLNNCWQYLLKRKILMTISAVEEINGELMGIIWRPKK